ncbi:hypothetical protein Q9966_005452 [Columba livia]|nr:hypothetical protein Q9966_005452 [Columba livia]
MNIEIVTDTYFEELDIVSPVKDKTRDQVNGGFQQRRCRSTGHSCCRNCVPSLCPSDLYTCPGEVEAAAPYVAFAVFGVPGLKIQ